MTIWMRKGKSKKNHFFFLIFKLVNSNYLISHFDTSFENSPINVYDSNPLSGRSTTVNRKIN